METKQNELNSLVHQLEVKASDKRLRLTDNQRDYIKIVSIKNFKNIKNMISVNNVISSNIISDDFPSTIQDCLYRIRDKWIEIRGHL